ncbi:hypothetical protein CVFO_0336 [Isorropodon fossajaponicum endosymbiont JTNG4]|uniref:hypothetical protein n=1 Tax=Isorropodon fossajaponicum symbiont TaxID=883811 RepID=UPI001915BBEA|nr:hypothetical protein [Isorropodon fossajaponicum symbiont]BBB23637.1 hypothetical protein CVFO_0336 [Isorropodon fossajaponicum endosymbiont JTNG4]
MNTNEQGLKEILEHEYGFVVAIFIIVISLVVKIAHSLPHINEFLERRNKSKAKKIEQALKSPNLSDDVKTYLQDKLMSEYFYHTTGVLVDANNIKKIIAIHQDVKNDIIEADFRIARDYIKSRIDVKLLNTFWYYTTTSLLFLLIFLFSTIFMYGLLNIGSENFQSTGYF